MTESWGLWGRNVLLGAAKEIGIQGTRLAAFTQLTDGGPGKKVEQALDQWVRQQEHSSGATAHPAQLPARWSYCTQHKHSPQYAAHSTQPHCT